MGKRFVRILLVLLLLLLPAYALSGPGITRVEAVPGGVELRWRAAAGVRRYRVYRQEQGGRWKALGETGELSFTDNRARTGVRYTYALRCVRGGKPVGAMGSGVTFKRYAAPKLTQASGGQTGITLRWRGVKGIERYRVFRRQGSGGWKKLKDTASTVLMDRSVRSGVSYTYTVRCLSSDGKRYLSDYDTGGITRTWIAAPSGGAAAAKGTVVFLTWKPVPGAAAYRVYQKNGSSWQVVGDTCDTSLAVSGLQPWQDYTFLLRCISAVGGACTSAPAELRVRTGERSALICIDPGHQGKGDLSTEAVGPGSSQRKAKVTSGATGASSGQRESELNLQVALKLRRELEQRGYEVRLTRTSEGVNVSNKQRAEAANAAGADAFIRIHADSSSSSGVHGISVLCPSASNPYLSGEVKKASRTLSREILSSLVSATGATNRGIQYRDDLTGFNWCRVPMTLVEMGFLSNPAEDRRLASECYQTKLVNAIADGIDRYFQ